MKDDPNIISQKTILKSKLFEVKELKIRRAGEEVVHQIAQRHPTVSVFPVTKNLELYLVSQYRYMLKKRTLEAMAGFIEQGETPLDTAKRELLEETGITANYWKKLAEIVMAASVFKGVNHLFLAKDLEIGKASNEEEENIALVKMSLSDALKKVTEGEINNSTSVIGILLLDKLRIEGKL